MTLRWNVVKHVPDTFRFEPTNVGVVVFGQDDVRLRFLGETRTEGKVDGRRARGLRIDPDVYGQWIRYFRRKASTGRWEDVRQAMQRRPDFPFYVDDGGSLPETSEESIDEALDTLYGDLVEAPAPTRAVALAHQTETFRGRVDRILDLTRLTLTRDPVVPALFPAGPTSQREVRTEITFPFGHQNGHLHLMEPVPSPETVLAFFARAEGAHRANPELRFLTFYRGTTFENHENDLRVMENYAATVDVDIDRIEDAALQVTEAVGERLPRADR